MKRLTQDVVQQFQTRLFRWWEHNRRDLPWRRTTNPYHIMVSEFMLQQTQVSRVIPKYLDFLAHFPTLFDLAEASLSEVLLLWSGLGYNRRAKWLQEAARQIVEYGDFPLDPNVLVTFKGIGRYTSHAIPIFSANVDLVAIDANVRKVLIYEGFVDEDDLDIELIARQLVPAGRSRDYHNALMDYGSLVVRRKIKLKKNSTPPFSGSRRELRGGVIRHLVDHGPTELSALVETFGSSTFDVVHSLVKDGLLHQRNNLIYLDGQV